MKKKTTIIVICSILLVLFIAAVCVIPWTIAFYNNMMYYKGTIFYAEGLEPKGITGLMDLAKYTINQNGREHRYYTSYDDIHKYNDAAWEQLLDLNVNKNFNENYRAVFKVLLLDGGYFQYIVDVDGNVAKVTFKAVYYDLVNGKNVEVLNKEYEWYMLLEDNVVKLYIQNEDEVWFQTERDAFIEGRVAFDVDGMLSALSQLQPCSLPLYIKYYTFPLYKDLYGSKIMTVVDTKPEYSYMIKEDSVIEVFFTNNPEFESRFSAVHRYFVSLDYFYEEYNLAGKDPILDSWCENQDLVAKEMVFYLDQVGGIKLKLPDYVEFSDKLDNFQFIIDEIVPVIEAAWESEQ